MGKKFVMADFHPVVWGIIFGTFLSRAGFFMSLPFLGIYLHEVKGFSPSTTGAILGVSFLVSTFASYFGGAWSDRVGRFPLMLGSMLVWACVFIGFTVAEDVWHFFLLNAVSGLCRSTFEPAARAMLTDVTPKELRMDVFNARYFAINMGGAIGPLAGLLMGASKNIMPFVITAILYLVFGTGIYWWKHKYPETKRPEQRAETISITNSMKIIGRDRVFRYFLIGNIFVAGGYAHLDTTLSQFLGSDRVGLYSFLFITNAISILVLQYPIIRVMKRFTPLSALKIGSVLFGGGVLGFGISDSMMYMILSMILFTAGEILCFIIGDVLISDIAPVPLRGAYFGAAGLQFIGQSAGAWTGGLLLSLFGFDSGIAVFGILALLTIIAFPFFQYGQILLNKESDREEAAENVSLSCKASG